ncbi:pentatricopeptide repeat-containing protein-like, mitochondrial [Iris pallida]|uniref:Pentatricopeptide repeat-containing protein-like, mitochondrial n=1 Tax=Iris pallida TaxID=29817 RepID=A0AAX6EF59_IRIPA|nr:pentatricopeptide repeat-containing protein-like, mitochondrial [Iris pallida]
MWAIRRALIPLRSRSHRVVVVCCSTPPELRSGETESRAVGASVFPGAPAREYSVSATAGLYLWSRNLSSHAGEKSSDAEEADQIEDVVDDDEGGLKSEEESGDEEEADGDGSLGLLEVDAMEGEKGAEGKSRRSEDSPLFKSLMEPDQTVDAVLKKWTKEGKPLGRDEIMVVMLGLRGRGLFRKALLFMEWLEKNKRLDFVERDYASHLNLIAKVHGLLEAENFIDKVPESFRGEVVYRTLLANCVSQGNTTKAEQVFNKIRDTFPTTTFVCNQLLLLYKRTDHRKKIADILKLMEQEDVQPSLFTYKLLIDIKGIANDVKGMEEIIEMMKSKGMEPDLGTQAMVARHYIFGGHSEKAEAILKEIEGEDIKNNRFACRLLLPLYASLGKDAEVERIWKACENKPRLEECLTAIEAWGEVGKVEVAEEVFEHMVKTWKNLSSKYYDALLKVYAKHKLLGKGKDLAKRMADSGCRIGPLTWDAIVKLYAEAGEVEKADSIIQRAVQQNHMRPLYNSYLTVMEKYAQRGDVDNAEKIFDKLKQGGYREWSGYGGWRRRQYQTLLKAYINSDTPAYGFRERMEADNVFPNKAVKAQLAIVEQPPCSIWRQLRKLKRDGAFGNLFEGRKKKLRGKKMDWGEMVEKLEKKFFHFKE